MIPVLFRPREGAFISRGRAFLAAGAVALGLSVGWATSGRIAVIAILATLMAAVNGYAKAHSP
jgi:hypothetical protein